MSIDSMDGCGAAPNKAATAPMATVSAEPCHTATLLILVCDSLVAIMTVFVIVAVVAKK